MIINDLVISWYIVFDNRLEEFQTRLKSSLVSVFFVNEEIRIISSFGFIKIAWNVL